MGEIDRIGPVVQRADEEQTKTLKPLFRRVSSRESSGLFDVRFVFLGLPGLVCQWLVMALRRVSLEKKTKNKQNNINYKQKNPRQKFKHTKIAFAFAFAPHSL